MWAANGPRPNRRRRGILSMELVLTLPILMLVLFALVEFSLLFLARGAVVEASRAAARKASLAGTTGADVEAEARRVLSRRFHDDCEIDVFGGTHCGDVVTVVVRIPMRSASPDLFWPFGYRLEGRELLAETRMVKE